MNKNPSKDKDVPITARREQRDFHPKDRRLRAAGWRIHSRPKHGEPIWVRDGQVLIEHEAWLLTQKEEQ